ncbi:MAG: hypothetical protein ACO3YM_08605 [Candidatus Kapaibacteriota bacterium]
MRIIVLACSLLLATSAFADITVSGITIPSTKTFSGKSLVLNGAGIRENKEDPKCTKSYQCR